MFSVVYVPAKTGSYTLFCVQQVEAPQISDRTDVLGSGFHRGQTWARAQQSLRAWWDARCCPTPDRHGDNTDTFTLCHYTHCCDCGCLFALTVKPEPVVQTIEEPARSEEEIERMCKSIIDELLHKVLRSSQLITDIFVALLMKLTQT